MSSLLEKLKAERAQVAEQLTALRATLKEFDTAIAALEGTVMHTPRLTEVKMTLKEVIVQVLADGPLTTEEVAAAVHAKSGFNSSQASVASTLSRLKGEELVERNSNGQWQLPVQETSKQLEESPANDVGASFAD
ncbi:hypothetical protein V6L76_15080 [Pannonibacter sp. Pt2]|uniref:HTH marR-type domain-containing protein n=1 Tax=Pannonibacter anstelovis TaxID=3121537 RepID=A0ABU7ZQS5_9HYPH